MSQKKLFAVMLGGTAPKANTELHDVVFVAGARVEDTYDQLLEKWFGMPQGLHLDCWMELGVIDGHAVALSDTKPEGGKTLYFINVGAYVPGEFAEAHANTFLVAANKTEAKKRGKAMLAGHFNDTLHTDDLHAVDDCLALEVVDGKYITLTPTDAPDTRQVHSSYRPLPKDVIAAYVKRSGG